MTVFDLGRHGLMIKSSAVILTACLQKPNGVNSSHLHVQVHGLEMIRRRLPEYKGPQLKMEISL